MTQIDLIQKEAKTLKFTLVDANGDAIDASSANMSFYLKKKVNSTPEYEKVDGDFNKLQSSSGIIKLALDEDDLDYTDFYYGLLVTDFSATHRDKYYFLLKFTESDE